MTFTVIFMSFCFVLFINGATADRGDDFSTNLFSDLAPLLALFGERVTMQFLSQSVGWEDNIILAMAPLGIITIITSAIRVGGPSWLKAIIGRARENLAVAEQDLMSSTSEEVCELWNGQQVIRCMGSTPIAEFICLVPQRTNGNQSRTQTTQSISVKRLQADGECKGLYEEIDPNNDYYTYGRHVSQGQFDGSGVETGEIPSDIVVVHDMFAHAPNLSLNSHNEYTRTELQVIAAVGTILQLGVIIYSGYVTYHATLEYRKNGSLVSGYAFPCAAVGTCLLVLSLLLCSHVVESRTQETRYRPTHGRDAQIVWLQKTKTVNDQVFGSFALFVKEKRVFVTKSDRAPQINVAILELKTIVGTVVGVCGFIMQFIGLRGMHWSTSIVQLGSVLVMTGFRAWARRALVKPPISVSLIPGFELDWFAVRLGTNNAPWQQSASPKDDTICAIATPNTHDESLHELENYETSVANKVMQIRRDLGWLADWRAPCSTEAVAVTRAMEIAMDTLFDSQRDEFAWSTFTSNKEPIRLRLERRDGKWKANSDELEAVLSLWLFSTHRRERSAKVRLSKSHRMHSSRSSPDAAGYSQRDTTAEPGLKLLGPRTQELHRDLFWWMPNQTTRIFQVFAHANEAPGVHGEEITTIKSDRIVGFAPGHDHLASSTSGQEVQFRAQEVRKSDIDLSNRNGGQNAGASPLLASESFGSLESLYAQNIFSSFMWALAKTLQHPIEGGAEVQADSPSDSHNWQSFTLSNDKLSNMVRSIESTGLGNLEDIYLSIIPPLSMKQKLPKAIAIVELAQRQAREHEQLEMWQEASEAYLWLFRTAMTFPGSNIVAKKATAVLMEFLRQVRYAIEQTRADRRTVKRLEQLEAQLQNELKTADLGTVSTLMSLYRAKGQEWSYPPVQNLRLVSMDDNNTFEPVNLKHFNDKDLHNWTPLHYAARRGNTKDAEELLRQGADVDARDLVSWTPLHCGYQDTAIVTVLLENEASVNARDVSGITPLMLAAANTQTTEGNNLTLDFLLKAGASPRAKTYTGKTPMHWAAKNGHSAAIALLVEGGGDVNAGDNEGVTPLHRAADGGYVEVVEALIRNKCNVNAHINYVARLVDRSQATPLHWASLKGHNTVISRLIEGGASINARNTYHRTPLHLACYYRCMSTIRLLCENGADIEARRDTDETPLHFSIEKNHEAAVRFLIGRGSNIEAQGMRGSPLHVAAMWGNYPICEVLLDCNADVEARITADDHSRADYVDKGQTPLHLAAKRGNIEIVKLLSSKGSGLTATDVNGRTAEQVAEEMGESSVVAFLRNYRQ